MINFKPDRVLPPATHGFKWTLSWTAKAEFCLWCDHHSSLSGKHSNSYNWHDIQPECVILFFKYTGVLHIVLAVEECCSESRGACFWPSTEQTEGQFSSEPSYVCSVYLWSLLYVFLYLSQHLCVFFIFAAAVLPGFRKAIYNGLKRISTGFPSK